MLSSFSWYPCKRCDFVHISVKIFAFLMQNQYLEKCCYEFILQYLECLIENFEHFWFQISNLSVYPVNTSSEKFVHLWCKIKHFDFYIFPHVVNIISEQSFWNVSLKILTISFLKSASCLCALRYVQVKKSCISGAKANLLSPTHFLQLYVVVITSQPPPPPPTVVHCKCRTTNFCHKCWTVIVSECRKINFLTLYSPFFLSHSLFFFLSLF